MPKWRQVWETLRDASPACCNTLNRQVHNRVCSVFVIAPPCRRARHTKTLLTLPALRTHRTRPQGLGNYRTVSTSANSAHPLFEKDLKQKRARTVNLVLGFHISKKSAPGRS